MAKKKTAAKSNELDAKEFFAALADLEKERGIPRDYMLEKITQALLAAYKRDHPGVTDNVSIVADEERCEVRIFVKKDVVETVDNPGTEMSLTEARQSLPRAELGDVLRIEIKPRNLGRIAAQTARQVIVQGVREAERARILEAFSGKASEILTGTVVRVDPRSGAASVRITAGSESVESALPVGEQVRGEFIQEGDRLRVYVVEVRSTNKGPQILISRTHPGLVKRLFELEVPEIFDGTVEIRSVAREAGSRTKLAVCSADPNVDAIGACVGPRGQRVNAIVQELRGEKMDIVQYSDNPAEFVAAALAPAEVLRVMELEPGRSCRAVVPDDQLSLAIGKEGQNARLAARLTGLRIDIRPASAPEPPEADLDLEATLDTQAPEDEDLPEDEDFPEDADEEPAEDEDFSEDGEPPEDEDFPEDADGETPAEDEDFPEDDETDLDDETPET